MIKSDILDMVDKMVQAGQLHTEVLEALGHLADEHTDHILKEKLDHQAAEHARRCDQFVDQIVQTDQRFMDFLKMAYAMDADTAKETLKLIKRGLFPSQILRDALSEGERQKAALEHAGLGDAMKAAGDVFRELESEKPKLKVTLPDGSTRESVPDKPWDPDGSRPNHQPKSPFPLVVDVKVDPENEEHRDYVMGLICEHLPDGQLQVRCDLDPDTEDLAFIWRIEWSFQEKRTDGEIPVTRGVALEIGHKEGTLVKDLPGVAMGLARTLKAKRKRAYGDIEAPCLECEGAYADGNPCQDCDEGEGNGHQG